MKFIITLFAAIVMAAAVSGFIVGDKKEDEWRMAFDRLMMEELETKIDQVEKGLLHLSEQYKELEKTKSKELKEQILRELTIGENFMKGALKFFEMEAKRTDLNMFERYNYEFALESIKLLIKKLDELAKKVKAVNPDEYY
uniref:Mite allergen Der p 21.0101 n=1 Tax=Dermatophagoides pteronyssinus TaxID=6956 RepID=ALL21_DERPT|nr:mite allergen Lep d 5-like [Dermatophagoides pteronyssinus]Q2L7C5.1 RecName: Full=Mite allergen Der p 21.0101; AltName: Full=Allergen Der p 21; AltName: Allergen=Der p 21.0101; Flags: Precursor [Dermatophagoides pteronyssinus]ABC73706.1 allergen precursor [Dermatophagoides pteronyssinus]